MGIRQYIIEKKTASLILGKEGITYYCVINYDHCTIILPMKINYEHVIAIVHDLKFIGCLEFRFVDPCQNK